MNLIYKHKKFHQQQHFYLNIQMASIQINLEDERRSQTEPTDSKKISNIRLQKQEQFLRESKLQYKLQRVEDITNNENSNSSKGQRSESQVNTGISNLVGVQNNQDKGKEIGYRIIVMKGQLPLKNELVLLIPKSYPFYEPHYYYKNQQSSISSQQSTTPEQKLQQQQPILDIKQFNKQKTPTRQFSSQSISHQLANAQPISDLMFWAPKYKILQLVELIAIKINQKNAQQSKIKQYFLPHLISEINSPLVLFTIAVLIRILVGLGSYSGKQDWPTLGDFQAHRNWMSITVSKPLSEWYVEALPWDDIWWRIDYPPVAAYLSYVFGSIFKYIEPQAMALQRGYESPLLLTFMRLTVIFTEVAIVFPALYLLSTHEITTQYTITKKYTLLILTSLLLKPDLISIDHGHFQYNSLIIGLILGAFYCLLNRNYYICCVLFTIAVHSKQMAVYYALAFFAGLIGRVMTDYKGNKVRIAKELVMFGVIVIAVSLIIWLPFIITGSAHNVLEAIFPVHRGLYQLKVQNFWCISDVFMKWQARFSKHFLMLICFAVSALLSVPAMLTMIFSSSKKTLILGFYAIAMTFFMFSYHVHEKSILLPLAIAPFLITYFGPWFVSHLMVSGMIGMYHLLKEDGQWLQYFVLIVFYVVFVESYNAVTCDLGQFILQNDKNKTLAERLHDNFFSSTKNSLQLTLMRYGLYLIPICLHLGQIFITPPLKLQYLHHLLFAFYSFCLNAYSLVICNGVLFEYLIEKIRGKKSQGKDN